jgi:hypothetical protein
MDPSDWELTGVFGEVNNNKAVDYMESVKALKPFKMRALDERYY